MNNKLRRLAELIQENFAEDLIGLFRPGAPATLAERLAMVGAAISAHRLRSETLWLQAGQQRTPAERHAAAQAELAGFVFACLTGDAPEHTQTGIEAMQALGRNAEVELIRSLSRR